MAEICRMRCSLPIVSFSLIFLGMTLAAVAQADTGVAFQETFDNPQRQNAALSEIGWSAHVGPAAIAFSPPKRFSDSRHAWLRASLVVLALFIGTGLAVQDQGLLIPFAIVVGPAFLATIIQAAYTYSGNRAVKPSALVLTLIGSVAITVGLLAVLALAAIAALFVMCFSGQMF